MKAVIAALSLVLLCAAAGVHAAGVARRTQATRNRVIDGEGEPYQGSVFQRVYGRPGAHNCTTRWIDQFIDHYAFGTPSGANPGELTYRQKYLTYDGYYRSGGPIFFYAGNEANIEVFTDIAGLMWENAASFGAVLIFAEHRFYGQSRPCGGNESCRPHFSTMQAMADYAVLLTNLTTGRYADSRGVICFGGSYGAMLATWMRIKYPNLVTGSIASSAPVVTVSDAYRRSSYWSVITNDATAFGGAAPNCAWNVYVAIQAAFEYMKTPKGCNRLSEIFQTCTPIQSMADRNLFGYFVQAAFDVMGMGDYPFTTDFMFGTPEFPAPAWPMREACEFMKDMPAHNDTLLTNLMSAISVMYNVTQNAQCYDIATNPTSDGRWDYLVCAEGMINELPYCQAEGWPNDMFYPQPVWDHARYDAHCRKTYGLTTRFGWLNTTYGAGNVGGATNIVFANGLLDPWHSGGILHNVSDTVRSYIIPMAAHHLDLFFTTPSDPPGVQWIRQKEMAHVSEWLDQLRQH